MNIWRQHGGAHRLPFFIAFHSIFIALSFSVTAQDSDKNPIALPLLGKMLFFDTRLSDPPVMGCVTCHDPIRGGTGPDSEVNLTQVAITGANPETVGRRKPQTNTYASFAPPFSACDRGVPLLCGGNFWDGRAQGREPVTDGTLPVPPLAAPHAGTEIFHDIINPNVLGYERFISAISDQALNPFPNPVEQNISRQVVCEHVASSEYAWLFQLSWGVNINCSTETAAGGDTFTDISFKRLAIAVGAYQHFADVNRFDSRRDRAIRSELACVDDSFRDYYNPQTCHRVRQLQNSNPDKEYGRFPLVGFTAQENLGHDLFYNVDPPFVPGDQRTHPNLPASQCAFCHSDDPDNDDGAELQQVYSDQAFHNIGVPSNPEIPKLQGIDTGLNQHTGALFSGNGFFKTPTVRNVTKGASNNFVKAFMHNGFHKSLESVVHWYNTRDVLPKCEAMLGDEIPVGTELTEAVALANNCWPTAEFPQTQSPSPLVGNLGLTDEHEAALVAYMKTLSDSGSAQPPVLLTASEPQVDNYLSIFEFICPGEYSLVTDESPGGYDRDAFNTCVTLYDVVEILQEDDWLPSN